MLKNNEFTTKNDFLFFQNEILGDIKNIDLKTNEKFNQITSYLETQKNLNEKKQKDLNALIEKLTKKIQEKTDLEKFEEKLKQSIKDMQDKSVKLEIKFNILNKDLKDACFRYDKIFASNLSVPGLVGSGCPYENLRYFIEFVNLKLNELIKLKDKQNLDTKTYKEKLESIIKQNQIQFDTMEMKSKKIIEEEIKKGDELTRERISAIYGKIEQNKFDNDKILGEYKFNLDKFGNDFYKFYREDWINHHNFVNNINYKLGKNAGELLIFNTRLKDLEEIIKSFVSYRRRNSIKYNTMNKMIIRNNDRNRSSIDLINIQANKRLSIKKIDIIKHMNSINSKGNRSNGQITQIKDATKNSNNDTKTSNYTINTKNENKEKSTAKQNTDTDKKIVNIQARYENNNELSIIGKSRNKNTIINKSSNINVVPYKSENDKNMNNTNNNLNNNPNNNINNNLNNKTNNNMNKNNTPVIKKLDFKSLNIQKRIFKNNVNENNKVHDNTNYDSNDRRENYNNDSIFRVINYNDHFNNINNNKSTRNIEIGSNVDYNSVNNKRKYLKNNANIYDNLRLNNYAIGSEFSEGDLHFVNNTKYNLSKAYFVAKSRLEEQKRLKPSHIFSTKSLNDHNNIKSVGKNKFNLPSGYFQYKRNKLKDRNITPGKYTNFHSSFNDYRPELFSSNFPSFYKNPQNIPEMHNNILEQKNLYLSYINGNIKERSNNFNQNANRTQSDFNSNGWLDNKNLNIIKNIKTRNKKELVGSSSDKIFPIRSKQLTRESFSNPLLNNSNIDDITFNLSYDKGSAKATLNRVKLFLIKKFKEDFV